MVDKFFAPGDTLERQNEKLRQICQVLMDRAEHGADIESHNRAQFEHAAILEEQVQVHTTELQAALEQLHHTNHDLEVAKRTAETAERDLSEAIEAFSQGFGLFDTDDVLVMKNSRFCQSFPDVKNRVVPGMRFADYIELIGQSRYLETPQTGGRESWKKDRLARYRQPNITFNIRQVGNRWTKVNQHQTPSGGTVVLQTDVTDIMRMQEVERDKLVDEQAQLIRATLEHIGQGICIFDSRARLVGWNQRLVTFLQANETDFRLGRDFESLYLQIRPKFEEGDEAWARRIRTWVLSDSPRPVLNLEVRGDLEQIFDIYAQEMPDSGFLISLSDVTAQREAAKTMARTNELLERRVASRTVELEQAMRAAKRANASKSRFVAAASHDVLQPLSAAKLFLASLDKSTLPGQTDTVIAKTQDALNSVEDILGALLEISKLESDQDALDVGCISLGKIFRQMANEFAPSAAAKGLSFALVPCAAQVLTDAGFFQRILRNLISNAIRYTDSGKILVGARRVGKSLRIEVHDTGRGIPQDQQTAIFREFYRTDAAASAAQGMGLGLAIVERACQRLGHPLGLESTLGKGTKFFFTVPLNER